MTKSKEEKTYTRIRILSTLLAVGGVLVGALTNNPYVAIVSVGVGLILLIRAQRKYKVILTDERVKQIKHKAGNLTFTIFSFGFALLTLINTVYPLSGLFPSINAGNIFGILFFMMMYCYLGFYAYYKAKM